MSDIKVESIVFDNFRAFADETKFDFYSDTNSEKLADFICIYGNNGMGKSSFVDGVEWFFTGKVDRIGKDINNYKKYNIDERILRNLNSTKEIAKIEINFSNKISLDRVTNRRSKTDYNQGEKLGSVQQLFEENQILPHSKIESFVLAKSPSEKFKNWCAVWDRDNKFTGNLQKIYFLKKNIEDEQEIVEKQIESLNNELEKIKVDETLIKNFNESIRKVNEYFDENEQLPYIILNEKLFTFPSIGLILNKINDVGKLGIEIEEHKSIIKRILEDYDVIYKKFTEKNDIQKNILELKNFKEKLLEFKNSIIEFNKSYPIFSFYNEINTLGEDWYEDVIENKKIKHKIDENKKLFKEYDNQLVNVIKQKNDFIKEKNSFINNFEKIKIDFDLIEYEYNIFEQSKIFDNKLKDKIILEEKKQINIEKEKIDLNEKYNEICDNLIKEDVIFLDKIKIFIKTNDLNYDVDKLIDLMNKEIQIKNQLEHSRKEYNEFILNADILEKNILEIRNYIENNDINDCPVCKTPFQNKKNLVDKIDVDFFSLNKRLAIENLNKEELSLELILSEIKVKIAEWNDILKNLHNTISQKLFENENKYKIVCGNIKILKKDEIKLTKLNENLEIMLSENSIEVNIDETLISVKNKIFNKFEVNIANLEKLSSKLSEDEQILNNKKVELNKKIIELLTKQDEFNKTNINMELLKNLYSLENIEDWEKIKKNYNYYLNETNKNKKQIIEISKDIQFKTIAQMNLVNVDEIIEILKKVNDIAIENITSVVNDKIFINEINKLYTYVETNITLLAKTHKNLLNVIENYFNEYAKKIDNKYIIDEGLYELSYFNSLLNEKANKKLKNDSVVLLLKNEINTDIIRKVEEMNEKFSDFTSKLEILNLKSSDYKIALVKMEKMYEEIKQDIKANLTTVYSNDIMKRIYKAIEPKKDFNDLDYDIKFNEKDEAELYVLAKKNNVAKENGGITTKPEKTILPDIYFSSAQLNTLSLSLFLGDALNVQGVENKLKTIFIDDPIAHFDDINTLAFVDLIRSIISNSDIQIVITTHDEKIFNLFKNKISNKYYNSKFIEFSSVGQIKI